VLASYATTVLDRIAEAAAQRRAHDRCDALRAASRALLTDPIGATDIEKAFDALVPLLPSDVRLRLFSFGPDNDLARVRAADDHPLADLGPGTAWPMDAGLGRFRSAEALYMIDDLGGRTGDGAGGAALSGGVPLVRCGARRRSGVGTGYAASGR
jgi:hypothetical protein